jgi:Kdo2-lipid IVA lauroyltransferase/acyltransferase
MSWLLARLLHTLSRCPLRFLHALGGVLGWAAYGLSPSYRRRLRDHAALAGVSLAERRQSVAEAGRMTMELPRLWLRPRERPIADPVRWEGTEHVDAALQAGRGIVLLTPHMGSFEVAAQAYAERFGARQPITVLYRPARQAWLRELEATARARPALATAPATLAGVRQMLRALKRGETLGLLPDQVPPEGMGVWVPFFGRPAYTMTLGARLALQTGAAPLLIWGERLPHGAGYVVRVAPLAEPMPAADAGGDLSAAAAAMNRNMERMILAKPSQYLWGYHRYKQPRQAEGPAA